MSTTAKAAHTPGPWHAMMSGPVAELFGTEVIVSEQIDDAIICSMGRDIPEVVANARLIAAAPEMLEALEMVLPLAESYLRHAPSSPDNAKLETARAAIQKARVSQ